MYDVHSKHLQLGAPHRGRGLDEPLRRDLSYFQKHSIVCWFEIRSRYIRVVLKYRQVSRPLCGTQQATGRQAFRVVP